MTEPLELLHRFRGCCYSFLSGMNLPRNPDIHLVSSCGFRARIMWERGSDRKTRMRTLLTSPSILMDNLSSNQRFSAKCPRKKKPNDLHTSTISKRESAAPKSG